MQIGVRSTVHLCSRSSARSYVYARGDRRKTGVASEDAGRLSWGFIFSTGRLASLSLLSYDSRQVCVLRTTLAHLHPYTDLCSEGNRMT